MSAQHEGGVTPVLSNVWTKHRFSATFNRVLISLTAMLAIACQAPNSSVPQSLSKLAESIPATSATPTLDSAQPDQNRYESKLLGFSFAYPDDFVVDDAENLTTATKDALQTTLELWQRKKYQAIQAGKYSGGTELPPNVQISVYRNNDHLPLQEWVLRRRTQFVQPGEFQTQSIAGQEALAFRSTGLYEHENVVLPTPDGTEVLVISLAEVGVAQVDAPNQRAFEQVLLTFQFMAQ